MNKIKTNSISMKDKIIPFKATNLLIIKNK